MSNKYVDLRLEQKCNITREWVDGIISFFEEQKWLYSYHLSKRDMDISPPASIVSNRKSFCKQKRREIALALGIATEHINTFDAEKKVFEFSKDLGNLFGVLSSQSPFKIIKCAGKFKESEGMEKLISEDRRRAFRPKSYVQPIRVSIENQLRYDG